MIVHQPKCLLSKGQPCIELVNEYVHTLLFCIFSVYSKHFWLLLLLGFRWRCCSWSLSWSRSESVWASLGRGTMTSLAMKPPLTRSRMKRIAFHRRHRLHCSTQPQFLSPIHRHSLTWTLRAWPRPTLSPRLQHNHSLRLSLTHRQTRTHRPKPIALTPLLRVTTPLRATHPPRITSQPNPSL